MISICDACIDALDFAPSFKAEKEEHIKIIRIEVWIRDT